jgi:hypothetical protein
MDKECLMVMMMSNGKDVAAMPPTNSETTTMNEKKHDEYHRPAMTYLFVFQKGRT